LKRISVLSPTDVFIDLIQKGQNRATFKQPIYLNDLHFVVSSNGVNWVEAERILKGNKLLSVADFALEMLTQNWGTQLPSEIQTQNRNWTNPIRRKLLFRGMKTRLELE
ncbi:MAG: hypothetical protein AABZ55_11415, partial [Bdellovibrionota bacterium]